jgi:hypothetical protein
VDTQWIFLLIGSIQIVLGITTLLRNTDPDFLPWIMPVLMWLNANVLIVIAYSLGKRASVFHFFGIAVLTVNVLLTLPDEFGILDLITLIIDIVLHGLLLTTGVQYKGKL